MYQELNHQIHCGVISMWDPNWLKLKEELRHREKKDHAPTEIKIRQVNRFWRDRGDDSVQVVFEGDIVFTSDRYATGRIPDARRVWEQVMADRQLSGDHYHIGYHVCRHPDIDDARVNVLEIHNKQDVQCWVWLTEHWQTGQETTRVWDMMRVHVGRGVTQYRL